jgi:hypothetical protein
MKTFETLRRSIRTMQEGNERRVRNNTVPSRPIEPYKLFESSADRYFWRRALDTEGTLFLNAVITFDDGVVWDLRKGYKSSHRYGKWQRGQTGRNPLDNNTDDFNPSEESN